MKGPGQTTGPPVSIEVWDLRNGAHTVEHVAAFLGSIDDEYDPPVGSQVDLTEYAAKLAEKASVALAVEEGRIVGLAAIYMNDLVDRVSYVPYLGVGRGHRGRGLARRLIEECLRRAAGAGMRRVKLRTWSSNASAVHLYDTLGFQRVSVEDDRGNGVLSIHFEKDIR